MGKKIDYFINPLKVLRTFAPRARNYLDEVLGIGCMIFSTQDFSSEYYNLIWFGIGAGVYLIGREGNRKLELRDISRAKESQLAEQTNPNPEKEIGPAARAYQEACEDGARNPQRKRR